MPRIKGWEKLNDNQWQKKHDRKQTLITIEPHRGGWYMWIDRLGGYEEHRDFDTKEQAREAAMSFMRRNP